jgi:hypothetical protein
MIYRFLENIVKGFVEWHWWVYIIYALAVLTGVWLASRGMK